MCDDIYNRENAALKLQVWDSLTIPTTSQHPSHHHPSHYHYLTSPPAPITPLFHHLLPSPFSSITPSHHHPLQPSPSPTITSSHHHPSMLQWRKLEESAFLAWPTFATILSSNKLWPRPWRSLVELTSSSTMPAPFISRTQWIHR